MTDDSRRDARWDVRSGPRNYLALTATQAASTGAAFALVWLATRALGPAGYGHLVAAQGAAMLVMQFFIHWTTMAVTRFGVEEFVQSGRIAVTFWSRAYLLGFKLVLLGATSFLWFPFVARAFGLDKASLPLVFAWLTALSLWWHVQQALQAAKLPRVNGALLTGERLLGLGLVGLLFIGGGVSFGRVVAAYFIAPLCMAALGLYRLRPLLRPLPRPSWPELRKLVTFSLPLIPTALVGYLSTAHFDSIFIVRYLGLDQLGRYAVAQQISGSFLQLPSLVGVLMLPLLVSIGSAGAAPLRAVLPTLALGWSGLCLCAAVAGSWFLPLAFGTRYQEVAPLLWPLFAVASLAGPVLMGYFPLANARSTTVVVATNAVVAGVVNIAADVLLIPRYGLVGCAFASLLAALCAFACTTYQLRATMAGASTAIIGATVAPLAAALTALRWPGNVAALLGFAIFAVQVFLYRPAMRAAWQVFTRARASGTGKSTPAATPAP
jgi:O-antigen/teichoic acid export membrane protein